MNKRVKCTNHCTRCGSHFHSTAAYDAHRRGKHMPKKGQRGRRCVEPEDAADAQGKALFVELTTDGVCELTWKTERGITVWTLRDSYERISTAFSKPKERSRRRRGRK